MKDKCALLKCIIGPDFPIYYPITFLKLLNENNVYFLELLFGFQSINDKNLTNTSSFII